MQIAQDTLPDLSDLASPPPRLPRTKPAAAATARRKQHHSRRRGCEMNETANTIQAAPEAETVVLGASILDARNAFRVVANLTVEDFHAAFNRHVFAALCALVAEDCDDFAPHVIAAKMRDEGTFADGSMSTLGDLIYGLPPITKLEPYFQTLKEKRRLRELTRLGMRLQLMATELDADAGDVAREVETQLAELLAATSDEKPSGFVSTREMTPDMLDRYSRMHRNETFAVPTGLAVLDRHLKGGGLELSSLTIIAGRAGFGKSSLAMDIARGVASSGAFAACVASLEMERESLYERAHSAVSGVERWKIRGGIYKSDFEALSRTVDSMDRLELYLADDILTIEDLTNKVRALKRTVPHLGCAVVDYLQLVTTDARTGTRAGEVGGIARKLKQLAMRERVPVVALSQFSREHEKDGREPELRDLRESGEIEQHANAVLLMFGDNPAERVQYRDVTVKCAKQRDAPLFRVTLPFDGAFMTFTDVEAAA